MASKSFAKGLQKKAINKGVDTGVDIVKSGAKSGGKVLNAAKDESQCLCLKMTNKMHEKWIRPKLHLNCGAKNCASLYYITLYFRGNTSSPISGSPHLPYLSVLLQCSTRVYTMGKNTKFSKKLISQMSLDPNNNHRTPFNIFERDEYNLLNAIDRPRDDAVAYNFISHPRLDLSTSEGPTISTVSLNNCEESLTTSDLDLSQNGQ